MLKDSMELLDVRRVMKGQKNEIGEPTYSLIFI